ACTKDEDKAPVACFTLEHPTVAAGETAHYNNCSENAHHYEWDFGDGASSTLEMPTHVYNTAGSYIVKLEVFNKDMSLMDETTNTITVN
ncbi:MAG: PKD domain-containing protein, partial [Saprospiraceae bacterium]